MQRLCQRCFKKTNTTTMSIFNTQMICPECKQNEKNHPDYLTAKEYELLHVKSKNYNYEGYGLPIDRKMRSMIDVIELRDIILKINSIDCNSRDCTDCKGEFKWCPKSYTGEIEGDLNSIKNNKLICEKIIKDNNL